ncbi:MAG: bifunctional riboflavin kinase/FAD synthetase [Sphingomonadaceae bacterium]
MEVLLKDSAVPPHLRGGALALGNFDGVHAGHQAVIDAAVAYARHRAVPALAATFDPHPSRFFRPESPPFALTTIPQKLRLFEQLGLDGAIIIPFDAALANLPPEAFVDHWLVEKLGVRHVTTGHDFSFGRARSGTATRLAEIGKTRGFTTQALESVTAADGETVSSTRIREALQRGDLPLATSLLTRPFTIAGTVIHGDKRGRTIGVPTANVDPGDYIRPRYGVYAVRVRLPDGDVVAGVANFGIRPMFEPPKELLEVWLFDWSGDLYGQTIETEFVAFLRDELRLDGLEALKAQIARDAENARHILAAN